MYRQEGDNEKEKKAYVNGSTLAAQGHDTVSRQFVSRQLNIRIRYTTSDTAKD
jgi:hypothetical protein